MATESPPREIPRPVLREGRFFCPRCGSRLQFDQEDFICLTCGYEYQPEEREARQIIKRFRSPLYGLGAGLLTAAMVSGFGRLATIGLRLRAA